MKDDKPLSFETWWNRVVGKRKAWTTEDRMLAKEAWEAGVLSERARRECDRRLSAWEFAYEREDGRRVFTVDDHWYEINLDGSVSEVGPLSEAERRMQVMLVELHVENERLKERLEALAWLSPGTLGELLRKA
jgi:hypothetical protein